MNFWIYTPRSLRAFLLGQPLTDATHHAIRASLHTKTEDSMREKLGLEWRRSYNSLAALGVILFSAYVIYRILR